MATRLYSATITKQLENDSVTNITEAVGSAVVTTPVELTVDLASVADRQTVLTALEKITEYIIEGSWPPV